MTEPEIYKAAGRIIQIAMGRKKIGHGRAQEAVWMANEDPLAYWCGVEAIVALVEKAASESSSGASPCRTANSPEKRNENNQPKRF